MELRDYVRGALPQGASLRRYRGGALYVTDAPRLGWTGPLSGFSVEICGPLAIISPLCGTMARCDYAPDRLARELSGMKGASKEALEIFIECMKCAEAPTGARTGAATGSFARPPPKRCAPAAGKGCITARWRWRKPPAGWRTGDKRQDVFYEPAAATDSTAARMKWR